MQISRVQFIAFFLMACLTAVFPQSDGGSKASTRLSLSGPLTIRWRFESNLTLNLTPAFDEERIYLPLAGGTIVSLRANDGQLFWRAEIGGEFSASPVADERAVFVASQTSLAGNSARRAAGAIRALGREGGITLWMRTIAMPLSGSLTLNNGKLFAGGSDGKVRAFDIKTGEVLWTFQYSFPFNSRPVVSASRVYVGGEDGTLLAIDEASGKLLWRYRTRGPVRGAVAVANGSVYCGSGDGYVYSLSESNGRLQWRIRTGAGVQAVTNVEESLLVASLDNFVYLLSFNGARIWKRQLPGRISSQPLTSQDSALFTPLSSDAGVVLALRDGRQVNSLPTGEDVNTAASPILVGDAVLLTTDHGLIAFSRPRNNLRG